LWPEDPESGKGIWLQRLARKTSLFPLVRYQRSQYQGIRQSRRNIRFIRLEGRATVVLLTITPSTSFSWITEAMSNSSGSLRSGAILTTSLGIREVEAIFLRAMFTPFKRLANAARVCSPLCLTLADARLGERWRLT
jgi:hypothetical protein